MEIVGRIFLPPASLLLLFGAGFVLLRRGKSVLGYALFGIAGLLLWLLSLPLTAYWLDSSLNRFDAIDLSMPTAAQAIVVLGGGRYPAAADYGGDTVSFKSLERLRYGVRLAKHTQLPLMLVGGSVSGRPLSEAELMQESLETDFGLSAQWLEQSSRNTAENAQNAFAMLSDLGISKIILVTHGWHMPRAYDVFSSVGFDVVPAATMIPAGTAFEMRLTSFVPSHVALYISSRALREYLGRLWYRIRY